MERHRVEFCAVNKDRRGRTVPGTDGPRLFVADTPEGFPAHELDKMIRRGEVRCRKVTKNTPESGKDGIEPGDS